MKPVEFKEANRTLMTPNCMIVNFGTGEERGALKVFTNGSVCTSKWKMSIRERLHCLFKGFVWLSAYSGTTQPAVAIDARIPLEVEVIATKELEFGVNKDS